jgi:hypothetical protein
MMIQVDFLSTEYLYIYALIGFGIFIIFGLLKFITDCYETITGDELRDNNQYLLNTLDVQNNYLT